MYAVDIDGTICHTPNNDYEKAVPIKENIDKINRLYDQGHTIIYWTARGSTSGLNWHDLTVNQLISWSCKFHSLRIGKPSYDFIIDDKCLKIDEL